MGSRNFMEYGILKNGKIETELSTQEKYSFTWVIHNIKSHDCTTGEYNESPRFRVGAKQEYEWSVDIYMAGCNDNTCDYVGICAYRFQRSKEDTNVVKFSILNKFGKKCASKIAVVEGDRGTIERFILRKDLLESGELLPNDELSIVCEIFELSGENEKTEKVHKSKNEQLEVFKKLFDKKQFSDFKLVVKGKEFLVHRAIVGPQSPVFEAMFENKMQESIKGKADIDDVDPELMEKLLRFVYTNEGEPAYFDEKMLAVADRYQFDSLKLRCENEISKKLSILNVYAMLLFADQHNAVELKKQAVEFFHKNLKFLRRSENFKNSVNSLPGDLKTEIIFIVALNAE